MARPRKTPPPPEPAHKNGKPAGKVSPRPPDLRRRIQLVNELEAENRRRAGAVQRVIIKVPLDRKEAFLMLAERHNEELQVVLRACLEHGYKYFSRFAPVEDGSSPFIAGSMGDFPYGKPPPHAIDPLGNRFPPAPLQDRVFTRPVLPEYVPAEVPFGNEARTTYTSDREEVFAPPERGFVRVGSRSVPVEGILPSGSTPMPIPDAVFQEREVPEPPVKDEPAAAGEDAPTFAFGDGAGDGAE